MKTSKKIINIAGKLLMVCAFGFIIWRLSQYDVDFTQLANAGTLLCLALLILAHGANIFVCAPKSFAALVNLFAPHDVSPATVREIYCKSNLYKYLPGNIMHFIGRNQIAIVEDIPHTDVALATIVEMLSLITAAVLLTIGFSFRQLVEYTLATAGSAQLTMTLGGAAIVVLLVMASILAYVFRSKAKALLNRYRAVFTKKGIRTLLFVLLISSLRLIVNAAIFLGCISVFTQGLPVLQWGRALGLFVMSWVVGFITPGAPGGLGIREAIMCFFFAGILGEDVILYAALMYRIICIFGDMTSYLYVLLGKFCMRGKQP